MGHSDSTPADLQEDQDIVEALARFDVATLYEAAGQRGMIDPQIRPVWPGAKMHGTAMTLECRPGDNLMLHLAVAEASPGVILVANAGGYVQAGAWGEILTEAAQAQGIAGLAFDGAVRDVEAVAAHGFPIFSRGIAIGACIKSARGPLNVPIQFGGCTVRPGDVIVGDADGLVVIEREHAEEVYRAAVGRRRRETEIIEQLRKGRTTVELMDLPAYRDMEG